MYVRVKETLMERALVGYGTALGCRAVEDAEEEPGTSRTCPDANLHESVAFLDVHTL